MALWPRVLDALIALIELPEADAGDDADDGADDEPVSFSSGAAFNQLANAVRADNDPFASISGDLRLLVASRVAEFAHAHPGQLQPLIQQASIDAQQMLARYLQAAGLTV